MMRIQPSEKRSRERSVASESRRLGSRSTFSSYLPGFLHTAIAVPTIHLQSHIKRLQGAEKSSELIEFSLAFLQHSLCSTAAESLRGFQSKLNNALSS